ncbi:hypothetical protein JW758_03885 [Candidatus Peregrinibacteria bacterium]|nr:hypothetical protein [Candidatus Peregrinibacteria bacterium]
MFTFNHYFNYNVGLENRLVRVEKVPESSSEKPPLPEDTIVKMAEYKARKNLYEDWGKNIMNTVEEQSDNLKTHLNVDASNIDNPAVAYKHLKKLLVKLEKEWKKQMLKTANADGGVIDLGNFTYPYYLNPAPCKPLSSKEQAFLSSNGARMPKSQINTYQNLAMNLQMALATQGEAAFREASRKAGIDMSKAEAQRSFDFSQEEGQRAARNAKR